MHYYKVHLPTSNSFNDEYEDFITTQYQSRLHDGYYNGSKEDYEEDILPCIPNGSYKDDQVLIDNNEIIVL